MGECCWESVSNAYVFAGAFWMRFGSVLDAFEVLSGVRFKCVLGSVWDVFVRGVCLLVRRILDSGPSPPNGSPNGSPNGTPTGSPNGSKKCIVGSAPSPLPTNGSPNGCPNGSPNGSQNALFLEKVRFWIRLGIHLGIRWGPNPTQNGPQSALQTHFKLVPDETSRIPNASQTDRKRNLPENPERIPHASETRIRK